MPCTYVSVVLVPTSVWLFLYYTYTFLLLFAEFAVYNLENMEIRRFWDFSSKALYFLEKPRVFSIGTWKILEF